MRRALALAERGWGQTAPNPMVGAVVVRDGEIVGEGAHLRYGEAHAEVHALREAGERARGATVYVTLEPCNHTGKTPPCTEALLAAGVLRVVFATSDPTPVAGGGARRLRDAGIVVESGVCEQEARELNAPFFFATHADRPWVTLKLAMSLDGALTDAHRASGFLTGASARAEVQRLRANHDAIAVGVGTALIDRPKLTARTTPPPRIPPRRIIFDRSRRWSEEGTTVPESDVPPFTVVTEPDLFMALRQLRADGVHSLLVEGGAGIAAALFNADLVDRLVIFQAPIVLGHGALAAFGDVRAVSLAEARRFPVVRRAEYDDDLMTVYALHAV